MPKPPITYYGGKQNMLTHILPLIPSHKVYVEPFFGGGAVFFAKEKSQAEVINDNNHMVINFYRVLKDNFDGLKAKIESTLFSRATYSVAWSIYRMPHLFSTMQRAWAFYVGTNMGFACSIGSWGYDKYGKRAKSFHNRKLTFKPDLASRLELTTIECQSAESVIRRYDSDDAFQYIDPPYVGTVLGHYGGFNLEDYKNLLDCLSKVKGKFLLSSFPSQLLDDYIKKHGWHSKTFSKSLSASKAKRGGTKPTKTEVLTANYPI